MAVFELSFISALPIPFSNFNIVISMIIFVGVLFDYPLSLYLAFAAGLILDAYSPFYFGIISLSQIFMIIIIKFIFDNLFTNKSLYTLIVLGAGGSIIYLFFYFIFNLFFGFWHLGKEIWEIFVWQTLFNVLFLIVLFSIINFTSKKFKSVFLVSR